MRGYEYGMGQQTGGQKGQDGDLSSRSQVNCSLGVKQRWPNAEETHTSLRDLDDREVPPAGGYGEEAVAGAPAQMAAGDPARRAALSQATVGEVRAQGELLPPDLRWQN